MSTTGAFLRGWFDPEARQRPSHRTKGSRRAAKHRNADRSDSDSDTSDIDRLVSDDESIDNGNAASRGRLTVPTHRGHKRSGSGDSTGSNESAKSRVSPYQKLWEEAEKDFKKNHKTTSEEYYALKEKLDQTGQSDSQKKRPDKEVGFQNTLSRTQVFLNRSRRGKTPGVKKKINKFLTVFQKLTTPLSVVTAVDPTGIATPAWSGACILIQLCLNMTRKEEELLGHVERVVDIIDLSSALETRYSKAAESDTKFWKPIAKATKTLFSDILYFQAKAAHQMNSYVTKRLFENAFDLKSWGTMITQIETDNLHCQQALGYESHEKLLKSITDLQSTWEKEMNLILQRDEKVVSWVSKIRMEDHQSQLSEKSELYRDRGGWFVDAIGKWIKSQAKQPVYWLHGTPGMGKTFLISRAIDKIQEIIKQDPDHQFAYYYFSEERGGNTPEDAFRSLLSQLAVLPNGAVAPSVSSLYDSNPKGRIGMKDCRKEMASLIEKQAQTILIIDAVDECQEYERFLRLLTDVIPKGKKPVKILLSSKEGIEIVPIFSSFAEKPLNKTTNEDDIKHYVDTQVKRRETENLGSRLLGGPCEKCKKLKTPICDVCKNRVSLEDKLVALLNNKSEGMFKWVELQINLFFHANSSFKYEKDVENQLSKLRRMEGVPELNKVWSQIMERNATRSEERRIARHVFKWLLYSIVPLSWNSLAEAVAEPVGSKVDTTTLSRLCSNLIVINDNAVHFAHPTVREYFEGAKDDKGNLIYTPTESHKQLATTCLQLMKSSSLPKITSDSFVGTGWDIRQYAATFWPTHLAAVPDLGNFRVYGLRDLTSDFLFRDSSQTSFKSWTESWTKIHRNIQVSKNTNTKAETSFATQFPDSYNIIISILSSPLDPFFAACMFGLPDALKNSKLEARSQARNLNDELGAILAIKSQRLDALQMIINADIDVTKSWQQGMNTLHWAALLGTSEMVTLLQATVDPCSITDDGATALHLAAQSACEPLEKIEKLSKCNLDPNRPDKNGSTVLHYAVKSPLMSLSMMNKLERLSIDFKAVNSAKETALMCAVQNPNYSPKAIKKLLDEIDKEAVSKKGKTALFYMLDSKLGPHKKLIEMFLARKAKIDDVDDDGTPLHRAVKNTKFSISLVESLISKASINKFDKLNRTALHCAFLPCHEAVTPYWVRKRTKTIVSMLLDKGADCTISDEKIGTALHYLSRCPSQPEGLMTILLKKKVDVKAVDNPKLKATALHNALRYNKLNTTVDRKAVEELIKATLTTDFGQVDCEKETVLHRAIRNTATSLELLKLLMGGGVKINAADKTGSTALHYSVEVREQQVTKLLVDMKADPKCLDDQHQTILHRAVGRVTSSRASTISLLIKKGLDLNACDKDGKTALHIAASKGDKNGVAALLSRFSADVTREDNNKDNVLHFGASNSRRGLDIINFLLDYKGTPDINYRNKQNETPLHYACKKGSTDVVQCLLQKKADPLVKGKDGFTALHYAVRRTTPSAKIINSLIEANIKVRDFANYANQTPLQAAFDNRKSSDGYVALLKKGADAKSKNSKGIQAIDVPAADGRTALNYAASQGWLEAIEVLLKHGADINTKSPYEWTPLLFAAERGDQLIVENLLKAGATLSHEAKDKTTALHVAAANGHYECARLLLEKKASLEVEDSSNRTPLWRAVAGNHERVTRLLLQNRPKANVNFKNAAERTILHRAVTLGYVNVARVLLENGARKDSKDKDTYTPLYQAIKQNNVVMIALLLEYKATTAEPDPFKADSLKTTLAHQDAFIQRLRQIHDLAIAAAKGDDATIRKMIPRKDTTNLVNARNELNTNSLVTAIAAGQDTTVILLLDEFHADISSKTPEGNTPLHIAAQRESPKIAQLLLERKANVNAVGKYGRTPLHTAAALNKVGVAKLLLGWKGIQPNLTDNISQTPLVLAADHKHAEVAELLAGDSKVDVGIADKKGRTAMSLAEDGKLEGLKKVLVRRGGKGKASDAKGKV